jgi:nucleotide-binding universal stress UspA family protein
MNQPLSYSRTVDVLPESEARGAPCCATASWDPVHCAGDRTSGATILAAIGPGPEWQSVANAGIALGRRLHSGVVLLHVVEQAYGHGLLDSPQRRKSDLESEVWARQRLESLIPSAGEVPIRCLVRFGVPEYVILRTAEATGSGLLVLGTRRRSFLSRVLFRSLVQEIVDCAPCPVLVLVHGTSGANDSALRAPGLAHWAAKAPTTGNHNKPDAKYEN